MSRQVSVHLENWMALIPFRIARNTCDDFPSVVCGDMEREIVFGHRNLIIGWHPSFDQGCLY